MFALTAASATNLFIGDYAVELALLDELAGLAQEKSAMLCGSWKNAPEVAYWH